ncbi:MAG: hypothetical protein HYZ21_11830 [Chloroflexi bacterium]|nr:hypothetical protein [Chloroflexota bacterium]
MEPFKKILRTPNALVLVIAAIIALIGVIYQSNISKDVALIPINATSTAEARLTQIASQPTNTLEPTATESVQVCTGAFCFLNEEIDKGDVRSNKYAEFDFTNSALNIKGTRLDARVWIDNNDLPNTVRITVNFLPPDTTCIFSVGFSNGTSYRPSYHMAIWLETLYFLHYRPDGIEERAKNFQIIPNISLKANASNQVQLERENGNIAVIVNGARLIWVPQSEEEMQDINQLNRLFVSANSNSQEPGCTVTIEGIIVEELTKE